MEVYFESAEISLVLCDSELKRASALYRGTAVVLLMLSCMNSSVLEMLLLKQENGGIWW